MTRRILVAGVGNVFFGDDGFGVEVAHRLLQGEPVPPGVAVADFGVRGLHLAFELLETVELLVVLDATRRGGPPGTLYLLEPRTDELPATADGHAMQLPAVFATLRGMGGILPRVLLVGCEPGACDGMELSEHVRAAVEPAVRMVRDVIRQELTAAERRPTVEEGP